MSVLRNRHNSKQPFVILDKKTLWNEDLSLGALGLWARCISRPDNWQFSVKELVKRCKEGKDKIYSFFNELIKVRLCIRIQHRCCIKKEQIHMSHGPVEYILLEVPATEEEVASLIFEAEREFVKELLNAGYEFYDSENSKATREFKKYLLRPDPADALTAVPLNPPIPNNHMNKKEKQTKELPVDDVVHNQEKLMKRLQKVYGKEYDEAFEFMNSQEGAIPNPYGWLKKCLEGRWHKKEEQKNKAKNENRMFAQNIITDHEHALLPGSSFDLSDEAFIIHRGINALKFMFHEINFKEKITIELKKMGIL